jgi:hypothetical protein
MIVQRWDETISVVAKQDLPPDDYKQLEEAVLKGSMLDQEILRVLKRMPSIFHLGMMPTCSSGQFNANQAAKARMSAHKEALGSQLKNFKADLQADWAIIRDFSIGSASLRDLLQWLSLEQRRQQEGLAACLVNRHMAKYHPLVEISNWQQLSGQISLVLKASQPVPPGATRRLVLVIDFNTPGSRDALKVSAMISAMASTAKVVGSERSIVLAILPNVPKEDSKTSVEDDEHALTTAFTKAGFKQQLRFVQPLRLHDSVANKTTGLDWFLCGKLLALDDSADSKNEWLANSQLARTRLVLQPCTLPLVRDLVSLTALDENTDINTTRFFADIAAKTAQRGPKVFGTLLHALLAKVPVSPKDELVVVDLLPYVGDRQLALHSFIKTSMTEGKGTCRSCFVKLSTTEQHAKAAAFTERRLRNRITRDWLEKNLVLHDVTTDGTATDIAVAPVDTARPQACHPTSTACCSKERFCLKARHF